MSPARSKRQAPIPHRRGRDETVKAVAVAAGIVITTALLVWLMRPGPAGIPATGGLVNRQPRSSWLVGIAIGFAGLSTWWIFGSRRTRDRVKIVLPIVLVVILVATVIVGIVWPGGLLRHDVAPKPTPTTTTTTTRAGSKTSTTVQSSTSVSQPATGGTGGTGTAATTTVATETTTTVATSQTSTTVTPASRATTASP
jgi:hypothetical protein